MADFCHIEKFFFSIFAGTFNVPYKIILECIKKWQKYDKLNLNTLINQ